jgi:hypothetical protein
MLDLINITRSPNTGMGGNYFKETKLVYFKLFFIVAVSILIQKFRSMIWVLLLIPTKGRVTVFGLCHKNLNPFIQFKITNWRTCHY